MNLINLEAEGIEKRRMDGIRQFPVPLQITVIPELNAAIEVFIAGRLRFIRGE